MSVRYWVATALVAVPLVALDGVSAVPAAAADQGSEVLQQLRSALGLDGGTPVTSISIEGPFRREMGGRQFDGTSTIVIVAPDRFRHVDEMTLPTGDTMERVSVVAGDQSWEELPNRGGRMIRRGPDGPSGPAARGDAGGPGGPDGRRPDSSAMEAGRTRRLQAEQARWMLALVATPAEGARFGGVADSPQGKADIIEQAGDRGLPVRLFVDQRTHLPLMLSYQEIRPRLMFGPQRPDGPRTQARGDGPPPAPPVDGEPGRRRREAGDEPPKPSTINTYFSDYRPVNGVLLPHRITQSVDGQPMEEWTIEKAAVNAAVKPQLFEKKGK